MRRLGDAARDSHVWNPPRRNPGGHSRHSDVGKLPLDDAQQCGPTPHDEIMWRLRMTMNEHWQVDYHLRYLPVNLGGKIPQDADWVAHAKDPKTSATLRSSATTRPRTCSSVAWTP